MTIYVLNTSVNPTTGSAYYPLTGSDSLIVTPNGSFVGSNVQFANLSSSTSYASVSVSGFVATSGQFAIAESGTTVGNNAVTINTGAILTSTTTAISLSRGSDRITNSGTISAGGYGILSSGPDLSIVNIGTITSNSETLRLSGTNVRIENSGTLASGASFAILSQESGAYVHNSGNISSSSSIYEAIRFAGDNNYFRNDGVVSAPSGAVGFGFTSAASVDLVVNTGVIGSSASTAAIRGGPGSLTVENLGEIAGSVSDVASLKNSGTVAGYVSLKIVGALNNSGTISGLVYTGYTSSSITNSGTVMGGLSGGQGFDTIVNTGVIDMNLNLGGGGSQVTNGGWMANLLGGNTGVDTLINFGTIAGDVSLLGDNDSVDNSLGHIGGLVSLGSGNDRFIGGADGETVDGGFDNDYLWGAVGATT